MLKNFCCCSDLYNCGSSSSSSLTLNKTKSIDKSKEHLMKQELFKEKEIDFY